MPIGVTQPLISSVTNRS